jgi:hypothetical protein
MSEFTELYALKPTSREELEQINEAILALGRGESMSVEEELVEASLVIANQTAYIEELQELILDWNLLMHNRFPFTWSNGDGLLIQERIRELGIFGERVKKEVSE